MRTENQISTLVSQAPGVPGCYLWMSNENKVLYVGKAINLRNRLKSYLKADTIKTYILMENAAGLKWITTETGREALILEANLVKKYKPRFNVQLKDDKRYPYICVSTSEKYPRAFMTRFVKNDENRYFVVLQKK